MIFVRRSVLYELRASTVLISHIKTIILPSLVLHKSIFQPELRNDPISTLELPQQVRITSAYLSTNPLTMIHVVVGGVWQLPLILTLTVLISFS